MIGKSSICKTHETKKKWTKKKIKKLRHESQSDWRQVIVKLNGKLSRPFWSLDLWFCVDATNIYFCSLNITFYAIVYVLQGGKHSSSIIIHIQWMSHLTASFFSCSYWVIQASWLAFSLESLLSSDRTQMVKTSKAMLVQAFMTGKSYVSHDQHLVVLNALSRLYLCLFFLVFSSTG